VAKSIFQQSPLDAASDDIAVPALDAPLSAPNLPAIAAPTVPTFEAPAPRSGKAPGPVPIPANLKPTFEAAALRYRVPVNILMAIAEKESSYNPMAMGTQTQWGRAKGIFQYLDSTAAGMGINPYNPVQSIDAAARQIRERLDKGYSMADAVKEHHAGPDRKLWGVKTARYGEEALARAARIKSVLAPEYDRRRSAEIAPTLNQIMSAPIPRNEAEARARDNVAEPEDSWADVGRKFFSRMGPLFKHAAGGLAQAVVESASAPPTGAPLTSDEYVQMQGEMDAGLKVARERGLVPGQTLASAAAKDLAENNYNFGDSKLKKYPTMIAESVVQMIPSVAASFITRNPTIGAAGMGLQVGGDQYAESVESGRERDGAMRDAVFMGAAEAIGEKIPLGIIMKPGGQFLKRTLKAMGAEGLQEMFTQVLQTGYDKGVLKPEMSWGEAMQQVVDAGIVGAGMGASFSAIHAGGKTAINRLTGRAASTDSAAEEAGTSQPQPPITERPQPAPPSGPMGRALERAPIAPAPMDSVNVPMPVDPSAPAEPLTLVTAGVEYPVQLIGRTDDATWVKTESGEELQIPNAEIEAGTVQLVTPGTVKENVTVAPPPVVKPSLTTETEGNSSANVTSSPAQASQVNKATDLREGLKDMGAGMVAGLIDMYHSRANAGDTKDASGTASAPLQVAKKIRDRRAGADFARDEIEQIVRAADGVTGKGAERQAALRAIVDQFAPEQVDPQTGEITPVATPAPKPVAVPDAASIDGMTEEQLRERLKYLSSQAREGAGWTKPMVVEKKRVMDAIDAMKAPAPAITQDVIAEAEAQAATSPLNDHAEPTDAQKEAGNYRKGHVSIAGLDVSIENPAGTSRRPEWPPLKHSYGYVKRSEGADGDHVDVFLGPKAADPANPVFIVDQVNGDGSWDEHKVMVGFADIGAARRGYLANYAKGWKGLADITEMPFDAFKEWVKDPANTVSPAGTKLGVSAPAKPSGKAADADAVAAAAAKMPKGYKIGIEGGKVVQDFPDANIGDDGRVVLGDAGTLTQAELRAAIKAADDHANVLLDDERAAIEAYKIPPPPMKDAPPASDVKRRERILRDGRTNGSEADDKLLGEARRQQDQRDKAEARKREETLAPANRGPSNFETALREKSHDKEESGDVMIETGKFVSFDNAKAIAAEALASGELKNEPFQYSNVMGIAARDWDRMVEAMASRPATAPQFADNKLFTVDKVEAARARLREKMNRLNSGVDPEVLIDGMTIAGAYIEAGVRSFADYARAMRDDFGQKITPYLLSFWEGARNYPGLDSAGMSSPDESRTLHAALIAEGLPVEEAQALGTEVATPKKPRKAPEGSRTLRDDYGVAHIDGWTPIAGGQNVETDNGLKGGVKDAFLSDATAYLRAVASALRVMGFTPHVSAKGKEENPVQRSAGGPAIAGDVTLTMRHPDTGANVHAIVAGTAMRGAVPTNAAGISILYRVSRKDGDKYATSGVNRWAPVDLSAIDLADTIEWEAGGATPELVRDHVREPEPVGQGGDRRRVPPVQERGRVGDDPAARPDPEGVGAGQPADVGEPAIAGTDGEAGVRGAGTDVAPAGRTDEGGVSGDGREGDGGARGADAGARERADDGRDTGGGGLDLFPAAPEKAKPESARIDPASIAPALPKTPSPARSGPGNFHIENPLDIVGGGPVARFDRNRLAIETYNSIRDEGRAASAPEQRVLAGYTGWGSFGQELFQGTWDRPMPKEAWAERDRWLRDLMGKDEWESAQRSITNAHYTDPPTVMAMWAMMERMGFKGGRVLEPSMGIGNFFGMMPSAIAERSQLAGIELDSLTGGMAKLLYPDANVRVMGYQDSTTPDGFYDAVIGNWPFENTTIADRRYDRLSPFLHDYFFLKAVDQVRAGGIVMGITSSGSMDKKATGIRRELAKKAELVAAYRLPSGAFAEYAGTKVVTDIVILRKRAEPISLADNEGWINSVPYRTPGGEVSLNEYYVANPSHVIGTIDFGHGTTRGRPGMIVHRPDDMREQLQRIVETVPEGVYAAEARAQHISYVANHTADREGALTSTDKGLFIVRGEHLAPAAEVRPYAVKDAAETAVRVDQLGRIVDLRQKYATLIDAERAGDATAARKALKSAFTAFTAKHGPIADSFGLSYLRKIDDPFYPAIAALEIDGKPAAILSRSTMRAAPMIDNPNVPESFVLERNAAVNPSLAAIAQRAGVSEDAAKAELLGSGAVFELPSGDIVPSDMYLSGNVREKLRQAKAAVAEGMGQLQRNVDALQAVVPADVPYFKIETQLGATWVSSDIYGEFVGHMLGMPDGKGAEVRYNAGRWTVRISDKLKARPEASTGYGTAEYSFQRLVNAAFSNQTVTIRRKDSEGGTYVDHAATEEVNGKISEMRTKFADWLWSDPERRVAVEAEYNEVRNAFATPKFDGSFLRFEGMALSLGNGPFDLRQHQADAIWRALVSRRSLNAHEVGSGKTFTMAGIAVESRRYGIARKPLILAHNANSKTVAAEVQQMYPAAKVLYIDNLSPDSIDVKMRQIANDDWDAIVVPHSLIDRFAFREETLMDMAREDIAAIEEEAYAAAEDDGVSITEEMWDDPEQLKKLRSPTAKELVKMRQRIIETIKKQSHRASREGAIPFEELGVDMIMVDEAHEFKKPPISTRMKMKGLNTQTSDRSIALSFLTRYVRAQNSGGNVHLFTGTPITNTLTEVFHMMRYIMQEEMQAAGVDQWDGWFGSFAREVMDVEQNAAAEYEAVTRLAGFINVPELRRMIGQYMDVVFAEDMPEMQPRRTKSGKTMADELTEAERAELLNGRTEGAMDRPYKKVINVTSDLTPQQKVIFEQLRGYARRWRSMTGKERKDAMAAGSPESPIITEGLAAKASFDVRLYDGEALAGQEGRAPDDPGSKASRVVANVGEIYRSHPLATQVIFAEQGSSNRVTRSLGRDGDGKRQTRSFATFSTIRDIVERLVQSGIPREQIAVVDGSTSKDKRKEIALKMNAAKIRVVIGSTATLGVGVNMQKNLRAMHHMDAPWMPGDLEQRNGRGQRQANQWNTVLEYRYLTDRLDGRRWQVLAIKQRFITAFLKADDNARVIEGEAAADEQSDILQSFAEAAGDPRILIREKLRKQLDGAQRRERLHTQGIANALSQSRSLDKRASETEKELAGFEAKGTAAKTSALVAANAGKAFSITVDGKLFDKRKDADEAVLAFAQEKIQRGDEARKIGMFGDYPLLLDWSGYGQHPALRVVIDGREFNGASVQGMEQSLRSFPADIERKRQVVAEWRASVERMREVAKEPFHLAGDLERYEKALTALETDIRVNPVPPPAWLRAGAPVDTDVSWKGKSLTVTGHRWTDEGWYVLAADEGAPVSIPYMEAMDAQGINVYDERPFEAPEVVDAKGAKPEDANVGADDGDAAAHSIGGLHGGGFTSSEGLRQHLAESSMGDAVAALIDGGQIVLHATAEKSKNGGPVQGKTTRDGRVHLFADQLTSRTAVPVLLHEMFHAGVRPLIGEPAWNGLMGRLTQMYRAAAAREASGERANGDFWRQALDRVALAEPTPGQEVEELAAYAIEHRAQAPAGVRELMDRLVGTVKAWLLRRFGRQVGRVSPAQLQALAVAALRSQTFAPRADLGTEAFYSRVVPGQEQIDAATPGFIHNLVTKAMDGKTSVLGAVPLRPLLSEMGAKIPAAQEYLVLKQAMDAMRDQWHARADTVAQPWLNFRVLHRAENTALMDLMHEATLSGADPAKPFVSSITKLDRQILGEGPGTEAYDAAAAKVENDKARKAAHERLTPVFNAMPAEAKRIFEQVRDSYKALSEAFEQILLDNLSKALDIKITQAERKFDMEMMRIHESGMSKEAYDRASAVANRELLKAKQLQGWAKGARMTRLRAFFETNSLSGPYFPLARFGNFFVTVRDTSDQVISFSRFEKPSEQQAFADEMRKAGHAVQLGVLDDGGALKSQVDARFVTDIESILEGADVSDAVRDAVWQRWLETLPDMSVRTNRIHRKGRAGFSTDALRAFGHHMFHGSHQLARLKYALDMDEAIALSRDQAKTMPDPVRAGLLVNEMARRHQFIMNPTGGPLAQVLTSAAFVYFLSVSPAAALVNTTQTAVMGVPILAAYDGRAARGTARAAAELSKALRDFAGGKGQIAEGARLTDEERQAMAAAYETGLIERTQSHDLAGVGESGVEYSPVRTKVMAAISWAFHHTERMNREVTFLAAYRMARKKGEAQAHAIDTAAKLTWKIHFDYQNTSRPRIMQSDTAKVLLTFRNFNVNMLWRLFRDTHQAVKGGTKAERKEALIQLAGTTGMMMLSAGIRGTWMFGIAMMLAAMFFGDDAEDEFSKAIVATLGRRLGGMALNGVPGDLLGIDLSARIGMPDLWFRSPDRELEGQQEFDYWAMQILGAGIGGLRNLWTGASMIADGNVYRGVETMMPKFAKDLMRSTRYMTEGARTLSGDPIMEDMDAASALKQAIGFTPAELSERYDRNRSMKNREQRIIDQRSSVLSDYEQALRAGGDTAAIEARVERFNAANPDYPITVRSIRQSVKSREQMRERKIGGVYLNPKLADRLNAEAPALIYSDTDEE
jgi:N12 class adenine-specific DNA methylase